MPAKNFLFSLPVWQIDETSLEGQGRQQKRHKDDHMSWANCFGGPIGVQLTWPYRPAHGQADSTML